MANLNFNVAEHAAQKPLAESLWTIGRTPCIIADAVEGISQSSGNPYFRLKFEALGGENKGKKHSLFIMLNHENETVVTMGKRNLANIAKACGITILNDLSELKYQKLVIDVGRRIDKKTQEIVNSFGYFEPYVEYPEPPTAASRMAAYGSPNKPIEARAPLLVDDKLDDIPF